MAIMRHGKAPTRTGRTGATSEASREIKYVRYDDHPYLCMTCPCCSNVITCGFFECPLCETRYCDATGPPQLNVVSNPESSRQVNEARRAVYGATHTMSMAGTYMAMSAKLRRHIDKWGSSDSERHGLRSQQERPDHCGLTGPTRQVHSRQRRQGLLNYKDWLAFFLVSARECHCPCRRPRPGGLYPRPGFGTRPLGPPGPRHAGSHGRALQQLISNAEGMPRDTIDKANNINRDMHQRP